jgi:hypothetical protein
MICATVESKLSYQVCTSVCGIQIYQVYSLVVMILEFFCLHVPCTVYESIRVNYSVLEFAAGLVSLKLLVT